MAESKPSGAKSASSSPKGARKQASAKKAAKKRASAKKASPKKAAKKKASSKSTSRAKPEVLAAGAAERLHKHLASTGAGSRRDCELYIQQGRVSVNGKVVTKMGVKVVPGHDVVRFDGEIVRAEAKVYYLLNKPSGYICTNSDERGRPRAVDLVRDRGHRIYTVGRLDAESRGLILLTNDGLIANVVCHPRYRIEKAYQVQVRGLVERDHIARLEQGVWLAEGKASPATVKPLGRNVRRGESLLEVVLFEGRNREIRRTFARVGLKVKRLVRTRIGPLELDDLAPGSYRLLTPADLGFVQEAEALYLANKELWDAELPPERKRRKPRPQSPGPRKPRLRVARGDDKVAPKPSVGLRKPGPKPGDGEGGGDRGRRSYS